MKNGQRTFESESQRACAVLAARAGDIAGADHLGLSDHIDGDSEGGDDCGRTEFGSAANGTTFTLSEVA